MVKWVKRPEKEAVVWKEKPLVCSPLCEGGFLVFRFFVAIFFKFLAANLSFTQFVTCAKPLYCVDSVHHSAPYYEKKGHRTVAFFNRLSASRGACFFGVCAGPGRGLPTGEHIEIPRVAGGVVDGHVQIVPLDFKAEVNFQIVLPLGEIAGAGPGPAAVVHQPLVGAAAEAERVDHKNVERAERVGGALRVFFALGVIRHQGVHPPVLRGQRAGGPVVGGADIVAHQIARGVHPGQHFPFVVALKQEGVGQRVCPRGGRGR